MSDGNRLPPEPVAGSGDSGRETRIRPRTLACEGFPVLALNVTSASSPFAVGVNTIVVPRALFLDSKLWADFEATAYAPLASATFYGEDFGASDVSEDVAGLIAGTVTGSQASDVLDRLLRNATDDLVYEAVDITSQAVVAHLPTDVVRVLPWTAVSNGPTGAVLQGFWEKIGAGATEAVNVLVDLGQAVWDWGMQAKAEGPGEGQRGVRQGGGGGGPRSTIALMEGGGHQRGRGAASPLHIWT